MTRSILSRERTGFSRTLDLAQQARQIVSRDAAVNSLVAANIRPEDVAFADVSLSIQLHEDAFAVDLDAADVAAETCRKLAHALLNAADRIKPPRGPGKRTGFNPADYAA